MSETYEDQLKTICIIQVTRMGDLIQTIQSLSHHNKNNNIRFSLVALDIFVNPLEDILKKIFYKIYTIEEKLLTRLEHIQNIDSFESDAIKKINEDDITVLINLSWSRSSIALNSLILSKYKLGLYFDRHLKILSDDDWSKFVYTNVLPTKVNPFSLVDIYKKMIGIDELTLFNPIYKNKNNITLHPFSSNKRKNWVSSKWIEVIFNVLTNNDNISFTIVGSKSDIISSKEFEDSKKMRVFNHRIKNIVGQTSINGLIEILQESFLFVGHDSMVGHLAALNQVPCLTISLGTVRLQETTPYGNGHYNVSPRTKCFPCFPSLACDYYKCHNDIPTQVVSSLIECLLESNEICPILIDKKISSYHLDSINITKSFFTETGMLNSKNILDHYLSLESIFKIFYRILWLYFLEETEEKVDFPIIPKKYNDELSEYLEGLQSLFELSEFGIKYSNYIVKESSLEKPSLEVLSVNSKKLEEIDALKVHIKINYPFLSPIIDFSLFEKSSPQGHELLEVSHEILIAYKNCSNLTSVLYELIEKSLQTSISRKEVENNNI
jgi:ADP-heptose:LPS heptosyltransferase